MRPLQNNSGSALECYRDVNQLFWSLNLYYWASSTLQKFRLPMLYWHASTG